MLKLYGMVATNLPQDVIFLSRHKKRSDIDCHIANTICSKVLTYQ